MRSHDDPTTRPAYGADVADGSGTDPDLTGLYGFAMPQHLTDRLAFQARELAPESGTPGTAQPSNRWALPRGSRSGTRPAARMGALAAVAALALLTGVLTVVAAVVFDWDALLRSGFGTGPIAEEDLGVTIDRSQTVDGFTVTVGHAYADPYQLVMSSTLTTSEIPGIDVAHIQGSQVYDESGQFLSSQPMNVGSDDGSLTQLYNTPPPPGATTRHYRFEMTTVLIMDRELRDLATPLASLAGFSCDPLPYTPPDWMRFDGQCTVTLSQPIVIDFAVPPGPGIAAAPGPLTATDGATIDVEHVGVGRIGASVDIRGVGPYAAVTLTVGDQTFPLRTLAIACPYDDETLFAYVTDQRIPLDRGPATLRVEAHPDQQPATLGRSGELGPCPRFDVTGTWQTVVAGATVSASAGASASAEVPSRES